MLAPNAKLRRQIVPAPAERAAAPPTDHASAQGDTPRMSWARLLKRVFDIDVEHCPNCGGALKIIAAIEDPPVRSSRSSAIWACRPAPRRVRRLVESIYSRQSDSRKLLAKRKPTAPLDLSPSERRPKEPFARLPTALRLSRPVKRWDFRQAEKELTSLPVLRYSSGP